MSYEFKIRVTNCLGGALLIIEISKYKNNFMSYLFFIYLKSGQKNRVECFEEEIHFKMDWMWISKIEKKGFKISKFFTANLSQFNYIYQKSNFFTHF